MVGVFEISAAKYDMLRATEVLATADIHKIMQGFSKEKVQRVKIGKMGIISTFFAQLKDFGLAGYEEHYVFFAPVRKSFFHRAMQILVWPLGAKKVFALPVGSVIFEKPVKGDKEAMLLKLEENERKLFRCFGWGRKHDCFFKKTELWREFSVEKDKMVCSKDFSVSYFRWTDPDPWVKKDFHFVSDEKPMFFIRNEPRDLAYRISYPSRPALWGYEIDE